MKTTADKVQQVLRIADKIREVQNPRRAGRYFCLWVLVINKQPIFRSQS